MNNGNINNQLGGKFEEQFKNKFENAQFAPPAHLWEQIDAALDAKPWYKRPLFYWTSGLVAALLLVIMFWFTLVYDNSVVPSTPDFANTDKNKIENTDNNIDKSSSTKNSIADNDNSSTYNGIRTIQTPNDAGFNNIEVNAVQKDDLIAGSTTDSDLSSTVNVDNSVSTTTEKENRENNDVALSVALNDKNKDDKNKNDKNTDENTNENTETNKDKNIHIDTTVNDEIVANTTLIDLSKLKEFDLNDYLPFGNPYYEPREIFVKIDSTNEVLANNVKQQNLAKDKTKSSGIAIVFGINHTQGIYRPSFRIDSINSGLTVIGAYKYNLADTLPQMNISGNYQQTGFDVALQFGKNKRWSINTGLAKGKANYSFGSTNYTRNTDLAGDNLIMLPVNQVEVNYEWVQVPIAIGYQFGENRAKKFTGFAQLGTAIEFLSIYSYISADPTFTYALGNHRTTNTNVWSQVGINYHITNRWTIWGGGTYKSSLSSLINENGVTFSSQAYGWQVGTRFTIFNGGK